MNMKYSTDINFEIRILAGQTDFCECKEAYTVYSRCKRTIMVHP